MRYSGVLFDLFGTLIPPFRMRGTHLKRDTIWFQELTPPRKFVDEVEANHLSRLIPFQRDPERTD